MKKTFLFGMLLAATTASAQFVHIEMADGTKYELDSKDIKTMKVDNEAPKKKVTVDGVTYTLTVGGTIGEAVDLGLPSGTLWASHNIGATKPEEYGAYLAWAEVGAEEEGYTNGVKSNYTWSTTKYCNNGNSSSWSKYVATSSYGTVDNKTVLEAMDDAATVNWGDDWRMPTYDEQTELLTKCTWNWVTTDVKDANGNFIKGYNVVGPNGNSIFLPASGRRYDSSLDGVGSLGHYWSSSLLASASGSAYRLYFDSSRYDWRYSFRLGGFSVRPVCAQKKESSTTAKVDGQINGHDYVEIGGKKWATMNIGATSVAESDVVETPSYIKSFDSNCKITKVYSCFGTYFKWGETTATNGTYDYPTLNSCDKPTLCKEHDAATVNWGSKWRTPTLADFQALSNACAGTTDTSNPKKPTAEITEGGIYWLSATQEYESDYTGVAGILFVDKADPTKRVFFPAAGDVDGTTLYGAGSYGDCWSSLLYAFHTNFVWVLNFGSDIVNPGNFSLDRGYGFTVRPVSD